jgi:hypothetical protein
MAKPKRARTARILIAAPPRRGIYRMNGAATMTLAQWRRVFNQPAAISPPRSKEPGP